MCVKETFIFLFFFPFLSPFSFLQSPDEVDLKEGDIIEVLHSSHADWWHGIVAGKLKKLVYQKEK